MLLLNLEESVLFTIESFCNAIWDISYSKVSLNITKDVYKKFEIPKKDGTRTINYVAKDTNLWALQHKLLVKFLEKQDLPVCVKGFRKGESYYSFLSEHVGSEFFLRIDVSSFFPSITHKQIRSEVARLLICDSEKDKEKILDLICDITTLNGSLPQGACTSPAISNLVMARIDQRITKYCQVFNVRYTRYADDLLFSSNTLDFSKKKWFLKKIKYILSSKNLRLNYSKIKFGQKRLVLNGYIISSDGISLSRNRLSDIRHVVSFAQKNYNLLKTSGSTNFLQQLNKLPMRHRNLNYYPFKTIFQFVQYLCGYRAFLISLVETNYADPNFQKELQRLIYKIETQIVLYI